MASRFPSSAFGSSFPVLPVVVTAIITLIVGGLGGFYFGRSNGTTVANDAAAIASNSYTGISEAGPGAGGAVKAATSLIVGLPDLALRPDLVRQNDVPGLFASTASQAARDTLEASILNLRTQLVPDGGTTTNSRVVTLPASYKTVVNQDQSVVVSIWYTSVFADRGTQIFRSSWSTAAVTLVYADGWKIRDLTNTNGPAPDLYTADGRSGDITAAQSVFDRSFAYRYALALSR